MSATVPLFYCQPHNTKATRQDTRFATGNRMPVQRHDRTPVLMLQDVSGSCLRRTAHFRERIHHERSSHTRTAHREVIQTHPCAASACNPKRCGSVDRRGRWMLSGSAARLPQHVRDGCESKMSRGAGRRIVVSSRDSYIAGLHMIRHPPAGQGGPAARARLLSRMHTL